MQCNIYMADYGEVRISEREVRLLELANDISRKMAEGELRHHSILRHVLVKARAIVEACERFAAHRAGKDAPPYFWLGAEAEAHHG